MRLHWLEDAPPEVGKAAVKRKPSYPNLVDEYDAVDQNLWQQVLDVASGKRMDLRRGDRVINSPNEGRGYRNMPANPKGIAWAIKQYKGFGGNFKKEGADKPSEEDMQAGTIIRELGSPIQERFDVSQTEGPSDWDRRLIRMAAGGIEVTPGIDSEAQRLSEEGTIRLVGSDGLRWYWDMVQEPSQGRTASTKTAGLKQELLTRIRELEGLGVNYDPSSESLSPADKNKLGDFAAWLKKNFRVDSAKTPRGQKRLKEMAARIFGSLEVYAGAQKVNPAVLDFSSSPTWDAVLRDVDNLVAHFSGEGDISKGKTEEVVEIKGSHAIFYNRANISEENFRKYATRIDQVLGTIKDWRKKALAGTVKVVFVGTQQMRVQGKYRASSDELWVKATPQIMKRGAGYASPEYILVHELGHRYEKFNRLPIDFDKEAWVTTRYSRQEGESFAELFALSHFGINGPWDQQKVERFRRVMSGVEKLAGVDLPRKTLGWID